MRLFIPTQSANFGNYLKFKLRNISNDAQPGENKIEAAQSSCAFSRAVATFSCMELTIVCGIPAASKSPANFSAVCQMHMP